MEGSSTDTPTSSLKRFGAAKKQTYAPLSMENLAKRDIKEPIKEQPPCFDEDDDNFWDSWGGMERMQRQETQDSMFSVADDCLMNDNGRQISGGSGQRRLSLRERRQIASGLLLDTSAANLKRDRLESDLDEASKPFMEKYDMLEELGQGSAGVVKKGLRKADKMDVAIKSVRTKDEEILEMQRREYELLTSVSHPNIIKGYDIFVSSRCAVIVLELVKGKTLHETVRSQPMKRIEEANARLLLRQLLWAIESLHALDIVHRDIKPQNLLVTPDLHTLKVADFNAASNMADGDRLTCVGTLDYQAPEVMMSGTPSTKSDIWGAGLCLHFMFAGKLAVNKESFATVEAFKEYVGTVQTRISCRIKKYNVSELGQIFLCRCLALQEARRPAADACLSSKWMSLAGGDETSFKRVSSGVDSHVDEEEEWIPSAMA
jgi:serine/threonine protein kinase